MVEIEADPISEEPEAAMLEEAEGAAGQVVAAARVRGPHRLRLKKGVRG